MRLLIDNALSPLVASGLQGFGFDSLHVRDIGLASASDEEIVAFATAEDRVIVSADTDFGTILTLRQLTKPSFDLLRGDVQRNPQDQLEVLRKELPALEALLELGAIVVFHRDRIRGRLLADGPS